MNTHDLHSAGHPEHILIAVQHGKKINMLPSVVVQLAQ